MSRPSARTRAAPGVKDRKSTRLNSSHSQISYAVFCLKKKKTCSRTHLGSRCLQDFDVWSRWATQSERTLRDGTVSERRYGHTSLRCYCFTVRDTTYHP